MTLSHLVLAFQWFYLLYFIGINVGYMALTFIAMFRMGRCMERRQSESGPPVYSGLEPPISVLAPAYNEEATIAASVRSFLQLNYSEYEIIVVNDGSKDGTLDVLIREFALYPFPEAYPHRVPTQRVRGTYRSAAHPNLRVVDKENGGKADALNAGINASQYPLFCAVDADSILRRDSLERIVEPFLEDPNTVAAGGTIRVANGCQVAGGFLVKADLPRNWLALFQVVEYLRAFLSGRLGWTPLNALLVISGAFGLFRKETVVEAGGYRTDTVGEDMELVVRLHRHLRLAGRRYRIAFVPDPVCWTEAPEDMKTLRNQRIRWQRGLAESLMLNRKLLFHPRSGAVGWLAFPFTAFFEWLGPFVEVSGYLVMILAFFMRAVSPEALGAFLFVALGFGLLLSMISLLVEEVSFRIYPRADHILRLFAAVVAENFGYRQLNSLWRLIGLIRWARGGKAKWGEMKRTASWRVPD